MDERKPAGPGRVGPGLPLRIGRSAGTRSRPVACPGDEISDDRPRCIEISATIDAAFRTARTSHRGPTFVDIPMDVFFTPTTSSTPPDTGASEDADQAIVGNLDRAASILAGASRPLLVIGSDVWAGAAVEAAREFVASAQIPTIANGMGRGILHPSDPLLVTRARSAAFTDADAVIVAGAPVDFRLGYGTFGPKDSPEPTPVIHLIDSPTQIASHAPHALPIAGDLSQIFEDLLAQARAAGMDSGRWSPPASMSAGARRTPLRGVDAWPR